jgi:hypothetical protein
VRRKEVKRGVSALFEKNGILAFQNEHYLMSVHGSFAHLIIYISTSLLSMLNILLAS